MNKAINLLYNNLSNQTNQFFFFL